MFILGGGSLNKIKNEEAEKKKASDDYYSYLSALGQMGPLAVSPYKAPEVDENPKFLSPLASNVGKGQFVDPEMNVAYESPSEDYYQKVTKLASMKPDELNAMRAPASQAPAPLNYNKIASMGAGIGSSKLDKLQADYYKRSKEALDMDRADIEALRAKKAELEAKGDQSNALPYLLALGSDFFSKDQNLAAQFDPAAKEKIRQAKIAELEDQIRKGRSSYTQGELSLLKTQLDYEKEKLENARKAATASQDKMKDLPAGSIDQISALKTQQSGLQSILSDWQKNVSGETLPGIQQFFMGSNPAMYDDYRKKKAQEIGVAMEGGKLTDVDYTKYIDFLPNMRDTEESAQRKIQILDQMLTAKHNDLVQSYGQGGYKVGGFSAIQGQAPTDNQEGATKEWQGKIYQKQGNQWVRVK